MTSPVDGRVTVRQVLGVGEFRALLVSSLLSVLGDQVARIAVALLVFERTSSAFAAAATYACSFLPWLVAGPVLSALADRLPRRRLMVVSDLLRAVLVGLLVLPGVPLAGVYALVVAIGFLSPAFDAAKAAVLTEVLTGDRYVVGNAVQNTAIQTAQVLGFLVGGAAVAFASTGGALAIDAASFLLSALLIGLAVQERPLPERHLETLLADIREGVSLVAGEPRLRRMLSFGLLGALVTIAPEGLAVPVGKALGGGDLTVGVLTAALPAGFLVGSAVLLRLAPERRLALLPPLVVLSSVALLVTPLVHATAGVAVLWVFVGMGSALNLVANAEYMQAVPRELRGRAFGVADTALTAWQGGLLLVVGALAEPLPPSVVLSITGAAALVGLVVLGVHPRGAPVAPLARR